MRPDESVYRGSPKIETRPNRFSGKFKFAAAVRQWSREKRQSATSIAANCFANGLGFIGSAVIAWIVLKMLTPVLADSTPDLDCQLLGKDRYRGGDRDPDRRVICEDRRYALGEYYVIVGYLFSLGLIIWMVLRL